MAFEVSKTITEWLVKAVAVDRNDVHPILTEFGGLGVHSLQDLATIDENHILATLKLKVCDRKRFKKVFPKLRMSHGKYLARKDRDRLRKRVYNKKLRLKKNNDPEFADKERKKDTAQKRKYRTKQKNEKDSFSKPSTSASSSSTHLELSSRPEGQLTNSRSPVQLDLQTQADEQFLNTGSTSRILSVLPNNQLDVEYQLRRHEGDASNTSRSDNFEGDASNTSHSEMINDSSSNNHYRNQMEDGTADVTMTETGDNLLHDENTNLADVEIIVVDKDQDRDSSNKANDPERTAIMTSRDPPTHHNLTRPIRAVDPLIENTVKPVQNMQQGHMNESHFDTTVSQCHDSIYLPIIDKSLNSPRHETSPITHSADTDALDQDDYPLNLSVSNWPSFSNIPSIDYTPNIYQVIPTYHSIDTTPSVDNIPRVDNITSANNTPSVLNIPSTCEPWPTTATCPPPQDSAAVTVPMVNPRTSNSDIQTDLGGQRAFLSEPHLKAAARIVSPPLYAWDDIVSYIRSCPPTVMPDINKCKQTDPETRNNPSHKTMIGNELPQALYLRVCDNAGRPHDTRVSQVPCDLLHGVTTTQLVTDFTPDIHTNYAVEMRAPEYVIPDGNGNNDVITRAGTHVSPLVHDNDDVTLRAGPHDVSCVPVHDDVIATTGGDAASGDPDNDSMDVLHSTEREMISGSHGNESVLCGSIDTTNMSEIPCLEWRKTITDGVVDLDVLGTGDVIYITDTGHVRLLSQDGMSVSNALVDTLETNTVILRISVNRTTGDVAVASACPDMLYIYRHDNGKWELHTSHTLKVHPFDICWSSRQHVIMSTINQVLKYSVTARQVEWDKSTDFVNSICTDSKDNVYVVLRGEDIIQVYNSNGDALHTIPRDPRTSEMYDPRAVCIDSTDTLYVLHYDYDYVAVDSDDSNDSDDSIDLDDSLPYEPVVSVYATDGSYVRRLITLDASTHIDQYCPYGMVIHDNTVIIGHGHKITKYRLPHLSF